MTTKAIADRLGIPKSLLGVDLVCRGEPVAFDVTEQQILSHLGDTPARIVVTPIGGQGFVWSWKSADQSARHQCRRK